MFRFLILFLLLFIATPLKAQWVYTESGENGLLRYNAGIRVISNAGFDEFVVGDIIFFCQSTKELSLLSYNIEIPVDVPVVEMMPPLEMMNSLGTIRLTISNNTESFVPMKPFKSSDDVRGLPGGANIPTIVSPEGRFTASSPKDFPPGDAGDDNIVNLLSLAYAMSSIAAAKGPTEDVIFFDFFSWGNDQRDIYYRLVVSTNDSTSAVSRFWSFCAGSHGAVFLKKWS